MYLHIRLENLKGILPGAGIPHFGSFPVDHLPDVFDVRGLAVEVLQVIGVLPHVDAKDQRVADDDGLLVGQRDDVKLACPRFSHQPAPAAALDAEQRRVERVPELFEAAPRRGDGRQERGCGPGACVGRRGRGQVLPEQRVVNVATSVKPDHRELCSRVWQVSLGESRGGS
jgi:hypothetical protein